MDNASFHHSEKLEQMCFGKGVKLVYLPPYSPDLNPIEEFFAELKAFIRRHWQSYAENPDQMEYNCTKKIHPQIAAQFRPWLQSQVTTRTTAQDDANAEVNDRDAEMLDAEAEMTDPDAESSDNHAATNNEDDLRQLACQVLADMLGIANEAPPRLKMDDYRQLSLKGSTNRGQKYSIRGLLSSAPCSIDPRQATPFAQARPLPTRSRDPDQDASCGVRVVRVLSGVLASSVLSSVWLALSVPASFCLLRSYLFINAMLAYRLNVIPQWLGGRRASI
jgi:hypothetical protein